MARRFTARKLRKYVILPTGLMLIDAVAEVVIYKLQLIESAMWRVIAIMAMVGFGFGLMSFVLAPWGERRLQGLYRSTRRGWGVAGELVLLGGLALVLFVLYYELYIHGPESVLPAAWHN